MQRGRPEYRAWCFLPCRPRHGVWGTHCRPRPDRRRNFQLLEGLDHFNVGRGHLIFRQMFGNVVVREVALFRASKTSSLILLVAQIGLGLHLFDGDFLLASLALLRVICGTVRFFFLAAFFLATFFLAAFSEPPNWKPPSWEPPSWCRLLGYSLLRCRFWDRLFGQCFLRRRLFLAFRGIFGGLALAFFGGFWGLLSWLQSSYRPFWRSSSLKRSF